MFIYCNVFINNTLLMDYNITQSWGHYFCRNSIKVKTEISNLQYSVNKIEMA